MLKNGCQPSAGEDAGVQPLLRTCLGKCLRNPNPADTYLRRRFVLADFLAAVMERMRMQGIVCSVVLSKSIKPQSWDLTIYHILVHLISNGNVK